MLKHISINSASMEGSSALRRLDSILVSAREHGNPTSPAGLSLLQAMDVPPQPQNISDFYELMNQAEEEGRSIISRPNLNRYLQTLQGLKQFAGAQHLWGIQLKVLSDFVEDKSILLALDALAEFFDTENPSITLDLAFLNDLESDLAGLAETISSSSLTRDLKLSLLSHISDMRKAIRRYGLVGTEGLRKATQSLVADIMMSEDEFDTNDKSNPLFKHVKATALAILLYITPSPYDVIGAAPDLTSFWIPKFEELSRGRSEIEGKIDQASSIQDAAKLSARTFCKEEQRRLPGGADQKALPAGKDDVEVVSE